MYSDYARPGRNIYYHNMYIRLWNFKIILIYVGNILFSMDIYILIVLSFLRKSFDKH